MAGIFSLILFNAADSDESAAKTVVEAVHNTLVPSHSIALWLMKMIRRLLDWCGLERNDTIEEVVYTAIVLAVALLIGMVLRKLIVVVARRVVQLRHSQATKELLSQRVLRKCSHIIPPLVFVALIPFAFQTDEKTLDWILRIVGVYTLVTFAIAICAVLEYIWVRFDERENTKNHPLKGILNVCRGLVWIIIVIISVSILIDKSPVTLLAGLGAFAAALMLIFKDSILGFVAGIQLSQNDMLRVGDWINVPSTIANGIVMDVTLTVVKVQNFDNTMVMLPPYTLVSTSFQNWRNMFEVGYRMIDHNIFIDRSSVKLTTPEQITDLRSRYPLLDEFINHQEQAKKAAGNMAIYAQEYNNTHGINGTIDTNLGLFRAYGCAYLIHHPKVNSQTQDMLLTMDPPESYGVALNVNCYSNMTGWGQFEALKAEIIEHLTAVANDFGLITFNSPDRNTFTINTRNADALKSPSIKQPTKPQTVAMSQQATSTSQSAQNNIPNKSNHQR